MLGESGNGVVVLLDSERPLRIGRAGFSGPQRRRHRLDLLAAGRDLSPHSGNQTTKSIGYASPLRRSSRPIGDRVWAIGAEALETRLDQFVERKAIQRLEALDHDIPDTPRRLASGA